MFQVVLFSMLHYLISQSNNSIFVHQRSLSCLIVCDCLLPPYLLEPLLPLCRLPPDSVVCGNHGDGSLLDGLCSGLEVREPIGTHHPRNARGWKKKMGGFCEYRGSLSCSLGRWGVPEAKSPGGHNSRASGGRTWSLELPKPGLGPTSLPPH